MASGNTARTPTSALASTASGLEVLPSLRMQSANHASSGILRGRLLSTAATTGSRMAHRPCLDQPPDVLGGPCLGNLRLKPLQAAAHVVDLLFAQLADPALCVGLGE